MKGGDDVLASLSLHDAFFSRMIDMIPKELYKPPEENEVDVNSKFYKHRKQPLAADVKKAISKQKRAEKYASSSSARGEDEEEGGDDEDEGGDEDDEDDEVDVEPDVAAGAGRKAKATGKASGDGYAANGTDEDEGASAVNRSEQMELLRQRLHARIVGLQTQRLSKKRPREAFDGASVPTGEEPDAAKAAPDKKKDKMAKRNDHNSHGKGGSSSSSSGSSSSSSGTSKARMQTDAEQPLPAPDISAHIPSASMDLAPSDGRKVDVDFSAILGAGPSGSSSVGKPGTKMQRLRRMLESAEGRRKRLEDLKQSGDEGKKRAREEQWSDVIGAAGGKSSVDATKIKKAIKRIEHDKQKSATEWQGRLTNVKEQQAAKQAKRDQNIKVKKLGQPDPKAVSADGQKKGRRGPGFEGKKINGSFLNEKHGAGAGAGGGGGGGKSGYSKGGGGGGGGGGHGGKR